MATVISMPQGGNSDTEMLPTNPELSRAAVYVSFTPRAMMSENLLKIRKLMPARHVSSGHAVRHPPAGTVEEMAARPVWQPGDMVGKYTVAPPAVLDAYRQSLVC